MCSKGLWDGVEGFTLEMLEKPRLEPIPVILGVEACLLCGCIPGLFHTRTEQ